MRGVIAECEYAPGLPFRIRYLRTSDTNFERTVRVLFVSARRAILQAVRPSGLQRQCDRAKGSQRRPGETTPTLSSSDIFSQCY